jgi:multidrug efflux pump subunit AcrA (membrane-fusion protein)
MQPARAIVVALVAVFVLAACSKQAAPPPAPRTVIAQVVGARPADGANVYSGEVRARYENDLAFRVGGKVVARHADVGATVRRPNSRPPRSAGRASRRRRRALAPRPRRPITR